MATVDILVASSGYYNNWTTNNYANVDEYPTADDATTEDTTTGNDGARVCYGLLQTGDNSYASIPTDADSYDSVSVKFRSMRNHANILITPFLRLSSTDSDGSTVSNATYTDDAEVISRPGGGSWALADFTTLQVGCIASAFISKIAYLTQIYITLTYTQQLYHLCTYSWTGHYMSLKHIFKS